MRKITIAFAVGTLVILASCTAADQTKLDNTLANVNKTIAHFCKVDQPIIGSIATTLANQASVVVPQAAPVAPITGLIVALVNGTCAGFGGVETPAPPPGTKVVVPTV